MIKITLFFVLCILVASNVFAQDESFYLPGSEVVNAELRRIILDEHNRFRRHFYVPTNLQWDYTLELFAQLRARELKLGAHKKEFNHRNYETYGMEGGTYGECLGVSMGLNLNIRDLTLAAIYEWKNETSLAMNMRDVLTELESSPPLERVMEINSTLEKKTKESIYEYGHVWEMLRWYSTRIGCSYSIGTGRTTYWDFNFVCENSIASVPPIPEIAWNALLFDLVTDATATAHPASRVSVARGLANPNTYIPLFWNTRKKGQVPSTNYATIGSRDLLKSSPSVSVSDILHEQRSIAAEALPLAPAEAPVPDPAPAPVPEAAPARVPRQALKRVPARPATPPVASVPPESAPEPKTSEAARPIPSEPMVPPSSENDISARPSAPVQGPMDASMEGAHTGAQPPPKQKPFFVNRPRAPRKAGQPCRIRWGPICIP